MLWVSRALSPSQEQMGLNGDSALGAIGPDMPSPHKEHISEPPHCVSMHGCGGSAQNHPHLTTHSRHSQVRVKANEIYVQIFLSLANESAWSYKKARFPFSWSLFPFPIKSQGEWRNWQFGTTVCGAGGLQGVDCILYFAADSDVTSNRLEVAYWLS